jgi:Ni/Fe-hydrogenase subunit HybB-like protein
VLAPATALIYALIMGMIAWDFIMSLEPNWFSTLIGPFFFMAAFLSGLMATALIVIALRRRLAIEDWILPSTLHDLGKLCFGFTVFWGYLFFSQFIVIWYGLLPTEQSFVIRRFDEPFRIIAQIVGFGVFVIPFFGLMGVTAKRTPVLFATFASISLIGIWIERYLLVYPSLHIGTERLPLGWQEPALLLLFAGLYLGAIAVFLTRVPLFQLWQPPTEIELQGVHMEMAADVADIR